VTIFENDASTELHVENIIEDILKEGATKNYTLMQVVCSSKEEYLRILHRIVPTDAHDRINLMPSSSGVVKTFVRVPSIHNGTLAISYMEQAYLDTELFVKTEQFVPNGIFLDKFGRQPIPWDEMPTTEMVPNG